MQRRVIGGVCLLTFLLSLGRSEEFGDVKQSEELNASPPKGTEFSKETVQQSNNDIKNSRPISDDLKNFNVSVRSNETSLLEEESKASIQTRKVQPGFGDLSTSLDNSKNISSVFSNTPSSDTKDNILKEKVTVEPKRSGPYIIDSQFNVEEGMPAVHFSETDDNINKNSYLIPQDLMSVSAPTVKPFTKIKKPVANSGHIMSHMPITKEIKQTQNNNQSYYSGLNILPPLYSAHLAATSNKVSQEEPYINPLFPGENNREHENSQTLPSYSYISKTAFEETRRDSKPEEIQTRNVDESQYSETMNAYPYDPPSGRTDPSSSELNDLRSGDLYAPNYPTYQNTGLNSAKAYANAQVQTFNDELNQNIQRFNPYTFGYPPGLASVPINAASTNALAQVSSSGITNAQSSTTVIEDAKSRVIWPNELVFLNKVPGGENVLQCTRENEMYHFWSRSFDCLVCICLNVYGLLEPLCVKCSGCRKPEPSVPPTFIPVQPSPSPDSYVPLPIPDPYVPLPIPNLEPYSPSASAPSLIVEPIDEQYLQPTTTPPVREVPATCSPLPTGQPFTNPLHPCQVCTCKETVTALGKIDFHIECQDNHNCVLPPEGTTLPPIPDIPVPVPLPLCEKFPPHVTFPHPTDTCKVCKCSLELSSVGHPEQQIICFHDSECVPRFEATSETITPPAPPIPIPVEPHPRPMPGPDVEPIPNNYPLGPVPPPSIVAPEELIPWPPISTPAPQLIPSLPKKGPLPGPSPHDSCHPYPPNQPFQHPWDECQVCQCSEIKSIGVVNVEISCYTKLSCCIESPDHVITEASSGTNNEYNPALGPTTFIPPQKKSNLYNHGATLNQAYAEANSIVQNSDTYTGSSYNLYQGSAEAIAVAQNSGETNQGYAAPNAIVQNSDIKYNPEGTQNQMFPSANSVVQNLGNPSVESQYNQGFPEAIALRPNNLNKPSHQLQYQSIKPIGSDINGVDSSATANAEYGPTDTYKPFIVGIPQNQGYAHTNALSQNSMNNPMYPGSYQPANIFGNSHTSAEASAEYNSPYNTGVSHNQAYIEANAVAQSTLSNSGYQPSGSYSADVSQNKAYAEAIAQYNDLMTNTPKPSLYGLYNSGTSQNQALAQANAQYTGLMSSTYKPQTLYNQYSPELSQNQYNPELSQNQVYSQANAQYNGLITSTVKPVGLYGGYNSAVSQNQVHATANALYKGALSLTDKPPTLFNPYNTGGYQNSAYSGANAISQSSLADQGYYPSGPYQTANTLSNANGGDQSLAIAEAIAQSQDYSPYFQPGSKPSVGLPYQSNYYYQNPQYTSYPGKANSGLNGQYKTSPVKYAGNYDTFNGQADAISMVKPQNNYNPYTAGHSQSVPTSNLYSSLYPNPLYHRGQYGGSSGQNTAQAYGYAKSQIKSGNIEDSTESK